MVYEDLPIKNGDFPWLCLSLMMFFPTPNALLKPEPRGWLGHEIYPVGPVHPELPTTHRISHCLKR